MRSNGLTAPNYSPVADLDPPVADALLDDLKRRGIAAYTKPVESSTVAGFDRPEYRVGVKDRMYVDATAADAVRELLKDHDPDLVDMNDDLAWEQIVAGFDQPTGTVVVPWPDEEDLSSGEDLVDERDQPSAKDAGPIGTGPQAPWGTRYGSAEGSDDDDFLQSTTQSRREEDDDPADRFVPPTPPPLPKLEPYQQIAWIGVIGGPALLLLATLFSLTLPRWALGLAVLGFVGGFVALVAMMGNGSDDDWDPGNGAVV